MKTRPTIKDVAARAGVSYQTVSRVINEKGEISDETRMRILAAIDELGYRPNAAARSMVMGRTSTLGAIVPSLTDPTFASIIEGAQAEARHRGFFVLTGSAATEAEVEPLLEEMLRRQVDGLLLLNPCADGRFRHILPLIRKEMAVVYVGNSAHGQAVSTVRCDDRQGGFQATQYLLRLGHTAIATILGLTNEECTRERLAGYRQALEEAGRPLDQALLATGDWSAVSGYEAARQLLASGHEFTGVFAQNDQMAVGAIRALREAGLCTPQQVSVIGFDDIPLASYFDPPLTTMHQAPDELGRRAAGLLTDTIHHPGRTPEQVLIPPCLVERGSCAQRSPK